MHSRVLAAAVCAAILITAVVLSKQTLGQDATSGGPALPPPPTLYNPYPPGILPADITTEIERVRREVRGIESEALSAAATIGPLTLAGQPPTIMGKGYLAVETLGKVLNFDENMSPFRNRACGFCHMPYAGFSGPIPSVNLTMVAYPGTFAFRAGKRTAQRYTYSPDFPVLELNTTQSGAKKAANFFGGNFWDARATGFKLQSPDAEQAQHPPVDTQEMGFPDTACIAFRLRTAAYRPLFEAVWGPGSLAISFPANTEEICDTPGGAKIFSTSTTPIRLSPQDRTRANNVFDHWGQSISFYEASLNVSPFTSKFDAFLAGKTTLSADEMAGYELFKGKGNCNSCHLDGRSTTLTPGQTDNGATASTRPLFTCFGYANLGLPLNPRDAIFYQNKPDFFGFTPNPDGFAFRDLGLGTFLRSGPGSAPNPNSNWTMFAPTNDGQMQTSTARDVAAVPPQCPTTEAPGPYFQKEFFHNGYIKSLKQLVHFYNTRDVFPEPVFSGHCSPGKTERVDCWPMPEVPNNLDMTIGHLGLSDSEENLIVTFLTTLTDGFTTPLPDVNTFTGTCMSGGTAATQGNDSLIPAPLPMPTCASDVCGVAPTPGPSPIP
jgi:cytochrome c peroxidase